VGDVQYLRSTKEETAIVYRYGLYGDRGGSSGMGSMYKILPFVKLNIYSSLLYFHSSSSIFSYELLFPLHMSANVTS